jgi:replication factor C subunit 3/5
MFKSTVDTKKLEERKKNLPWIEKYRPTDLSEVIAHDTKIKVIRRLIENNQLPHLLFYGAAGTGKTSLILAAAREMYGIDGVRGNVLELNASDERGIETIRTKIPMFAKKVTKQNQRLVILDEFDNMTSDAQSALRRIMEMYVKNCRFCLICNKVNKVIDGIKSRCVPMRFGTLDRGSISEKVNLIIEKEEVQITPDALEIVLDVQKDFRQILNTLQCLKSITFDEETITPETVTQYLGIPDQRLIDEIIEHLQNSSFKEVHQFLHNLFLQNRIDLSQLVEKLVDYLIKSDDFSAGQRSDLLNGLAEVEYRMIVGADTEIQLASLIGTWLASRP